MTWRERIVAARERGGFTNEDRRLAKELDTCAVGEMSLRSGVSYGKLTGPEVQVVSWAPCCTLGLAFFGAVLRNEYGFADHVLDQIEDRALELKRNMRDA